MDTIAGGTQVVSVIIPAMNGTGSTAQAGDGPWQGVWQGETGSVVPVADGGGVRCRGTTADWPPAVMPP